MKWLLIALLLVWVAFVVASYYVVQNAFLQPVLAAIGNTQQWLGPGFSAGSLAGVAADIFVVMWLLLVALGFGAWIVARLSLAKLTLLEEVLLSFGAGFGLLGLIVLFLGLLGLLTRPILIFTTLVLLLDSLGDLRRLARRIGRPHLPLALLVFLVVSLGLALTQALLPPTSWDGLFYHLTGPKLYLEGGRIGANTEISHLNFPALFEMLFTLAMGVRSDTSAVLIHYSFSLLLGGLVYVFARQHFGVKNPWWAIIFLFATPMVLTLAGWAYNDLALAFYEVAALYALLKWWELKKSRGEKQSDGLETGRDSPARPTGWLMTSGIMSGFALGLKYTSFVEPLVLVFLILWWHRAQVRRAWPHIGLFALVTFMVAVPWYAKNLAFTGNPVYPFIFGGRDWDSFRAEAYSEAGTGIAYDPESCTMGSPEYLVGQHATGCQVDVPYAAGRLIRLPYDLTLGIADASRDGVTGPLYLLFLPLVLAYAFFLPGIRKPAGFYPVIVFATAQYLFWAAGVLLSAPLWQSRLLLPAFVALCPLLAWLLEDLARYNHPRFSLQKQLMLIAGIVLLVGLAIQFLEWLPQQPWAYLTGGESRPDYLRRRLGAHYGAMEAINELPEEAVVQFLWEPRSYYCQRECLPDSILDTYGWFHFVYGDAAGMAAAWREQGISHVLLFRSGLDFVLEANSPTDEPLPEPATLQELEEAYLAPVESIGNGAYELFQLKSP